MRHSYFISFFVLCLGIGMPSRIFAQNEPAFTLLKSIPGEYSYFTTDNLDNIYLIDKNNNQLKKINNDGDSVAVFNDIRQYGKLSSINASNPLKILLFYKNFSTIAVMDRFLSARNVINFRKKNIITVNTAAPSYDNNIWLFDEGDARLKKAGEDGTTIMETVDFRTLFDTIPSPEEIADCNGFVYLYDPNAGFYIFDYYGSFKSRIPFLHWHHTGVTGNTIYGFGENCLYEYQLGSFNLRTFPLPGILAASRQVQINNGKIYTLDDTGIHIYKAQ